ncbi:MAG: M14 family zinc carboxypeptidase [Pyrinomonadaceae bacterium]
MQSFRPLFRLRLALVCLSILVLAAAASAQVPSPKDVLGFHPTDDKTFASWSQITEYFSRLDKASNRVVVKEIGKTTNGKPLIVAFISSPANIKDLEKYRRISAKLADPRTISSDAEREDLIKNGKTIVSIACSIHSTEAVAAQMSMNLAYELATANDSDTREILDNTILLLIPSSNPDGVDIVGDWYRNTLGTKSEGTSPPELYHHYAGHDDNRDWFMMNLAETQAITRLFWKEWFPQIVYDIHQQGQNASRFIIPPFFDPVNPRVDPSILREVGLIGYKMAADLEAKNIAGIATNSTYDTWWHGGFRSAPYYHNSIGILSEAASANLMSPATIKAEDLARNRNTRGLADLLSPATNYPNPWRGGQWRASDIANIETIACRSLLQMAAKFRPRYLRQFYQYGWNNLQSASEDPVAFVVTAGQPNAENVSRFLEILMAQGVEVHQMTRELHVKTEKSATSLGEIPLGSFVVFTNQPQRPNVLSLFEKQAYPKRLLPNGDAEAPYDVAGWTLPLQMGIDYTPVWQIEGANSSTVRPVNDLNEFRSALNLTPQATPFAKEPNPLKTNPRIALYKSYTGSMDEGWTRFVFDTFQVPYTSLMDADVRAGKLDFDSVVLPSDSERSVVEGLSADRYPAEFAGGIGDTGIENLKKYVQNGGKLICFDQSCAMVIKRFDLPVKEALAGLKRSEFYDPGSIVQLAVDTKQPLAKGLAPDTPAYFTGSSAFDVPADANAQVIARYGPLLSGWTLGEKYRDGKAALVELTYGKGKIVLFGFRPQHRGQTWGTFPFIFNALEK